MSAKNSQPPRTATPGEIADWIRFHCGEDPKGRKPGVTFLIGAGFSASTGIPTAGQMTGDILKKHPLLKNAGAAPPGQSEYAHLMSKLPPSERIRIIRDAIRKAEDPATKRLRINWAHLLLATLADAGYINQILTTNFDPLIVDALATTGQPVRAFDLTASVGFQAGALESSSIVYLHGQAHGLWLTNAPDEMSRVTQHLNAVFQDALRDSILVVVGYSGECDPVFGELISRFPQFRHRLYWVHHGTNPEPCEDVMGLLTNSYREAYLVTGLNADEFMRELVLEGLKLELPPIVRAPLESVSSSLRRVMPFPQKTGEPAASDPVRLARSVLAEAAEAIKPGKPPKPALSPDTIIAKIPLALAISMAGVTKDLTRLKAIRDPVERSNDPKLKAALGDAWLGAVPDLLRRGDISAALDLLRTVDALGSSEPNWQAVCWGIALSDQAKTKRGHGADALWRQAGEKFEQALKLKPDMHEALYNWGVALSDQAKAKRGDGADALWRQAGEKFEQALKIKPDLHEALYNWGVALSDQAKTKQGEEADALWRQATDKFERALKIKPDMHGALNNWAAALVEQAKTKSGATADALLRQAGEKCQQALKIKLDVHHALYNWGNALFAQSKTKSGDEADALWRQAGEKYQQAFKIKPDMHEALNNWGAALSDQAKTKSGSEADALWRQAGEKFEQALKIKPDKHEALNNWGNALFAQAKTKSGGEADELWRQAWEKYQQALKIKPDMDEVLNNWGSALVEQAKTKSGATADALLRQAGEKFEQALKINPDNYEALSDWGFALLEQAKTKSGAEADAFWRQSGEKYQQALKLKPDDYGAPYNLACLSALQNDPDSAVRWLCRWQKSKTGANRCQIDGDHDFDRIRNHPILTAFLRELAATK
jgi:Tfp pilus assembly protein PilF/NAD-dependent SIR2 family protein deacetylase